MCLEGTGVSSGIENNETGFVEKNDINILAKKLDQLIKNVDLVQKTGKNAKERRDSRKKQQTKKRKNL